MWRAVARVGRRRDALRGRDHRVGATEPAAARAAGSPRRCKRPPKAIAPRKNQPQPTISPAITSVNQCTPRSARDAATASATIVATAAAAARPARPATGDHQRERTPRRGRRRRVAGGERRARRPRQVVDVGTLAVHDPLQSVVDHQDAGQDGEEERRHVRIPPADVVRQRHHGADHDEVRAGSEVGEHVRARQSTGRWRFDCPSPRRRCPSGRDRCSGPPCRTASRQRAHWRR